MENLEFPIRQSAHAGIGGIAVPGVAQCALVERVLTEWDGQPEFDWSLMVPEIDRGRDFKGPPFGW